MSFAEIERQYGINSEISCNILSVFGEDIRLPINPRTAKMRVQTGNKVLQIYHSFLISAAVNRLRKCIFAYCVNAPLTYLCTPVGSVSLSACASRSLQLVEKYFFDKLSRRAHSLRQYFLGETKSASHGGKQNVLYIPQLFR